MALKDHPPANTKPGPKCMIGHLLATLPPDDVKVLTAWLADQLLMSTAITRALRADGHQVATEAVPRHRRHECRCPL